VAKDFFISWTLLWFVVATVILTLTLWSFVHFFSVPNLPWLLVHGQVVEVGKLWPLGGHNFIEMKLFMGLALVKVGLDQSPEN